MCSRFVFFFSSRRRHTRCGRDWSSDVCSSDLFAFSTMISWSYYGMRAWTYLFGKSKKIEFIYKMLFLVFVVIGASVSLGAVLDFSDMMILAMSFPNIIGLYIMSKEVKLDLDSYITKLKSNLLFRKPEQPKK